MREDSASCSPVFCHLFVLALWAERRAGTLGSLRGFREKVFGLRKKRGGRNEKTPDGKAGPWAAAIDGADSKGRLYRAGESVRYSGTREVLFEIGNAGAVAMTIAGKPAKPLGKLGATLRLRVTPENMTGWLE